MSSIRESDILKDKIIICTYPKKEHDELAEILTAHGAKVISMPLIETSPLPFQLQHRLTEFDWLIFTSKNAVEPFVKEFHSFTNKVAALGEKTTEKLRQHHIEVKFTGSGKSATDFGNELLSILKKGEKALLVLGNLAPDTLKEILADQISVERVNVYQTTAAKLVDQGHLERIQTGQYDALIMTSPSAYQELKMKLNRPFSALQIISIGKTTTAAIQKDEVEPLATSSDASYKGLAATTIEYFTKKTIKN